MYPTGHPMYTAGHPMYTVGHPMYTAGHSIYTAGHSMYTAGHPMYTAGHPMYTAGHPIYTTGHSMYPLQNRPIPDEQPGQITGQRTPSAFRRRSASQFAAVRKENHTCLPQVFSVFRVHFFGLTHKFFGLKKIISVQHNDICQKSGYPLDSEKICGIIVRKFFPIHGVKRISVFFIPSLYR